MRLQAMPRPTATRGYTTSLEKRERIAETRILVERVMTKLRCEGLREIAQSIDARGGASSRERTRDRRAAL